LFLFATQTGFYGRFALYFFMNIAMRTIVFWVLWVWAAPVLAQPSFVDFQKTYPRVANAFKLREDTLRKQFAKQGLTYPPEQLYLRSFKYDSQLEVWVKEPGASAYQLFKTYKVCAMAGALGPKRMEGDYQVPEGFYVINELNPRSMYNFSLGLNYPNASDKLLSDSVRPGGEIYIHGSCITVGCIPILDAPVEELYVLAVHAKNKGQDFIPVHVFPVRFATAKSKEVLEKAWQEDADLKKFHKPLLQAYEYFEKQKQLPLVAITPEGEYKVL
jgi:murein L,D-transpeptidase YafK